MSEGPRIAVLGAGVAGLTVAEELRERGFTNITVFEASARAGGKVQSVPYDGAPPSGRGLFEAGTVFYIPSPTWTKLLARYGLDDRCQSMPKVVVADLASGRMMSPLFLSAGHSVAKRARDVVGFLRVLARYGPAVDRAPGVAPHVSDALAEPAGPWFESEGLSFVRRVLLPIAGGAQFGPLIDTVPAVYVVRLLTMLRRYSLVDQLRLAMPQLRIGHERLWSEIAKTHDVRWSEPVTRFVRGADGAPPVVETARGAVSFDRVVVAMPIEQFARVAADLTDDERALLGKVRSLDRLVLTARVSGLPRDLFAVPRYADDGVVPPGHPYLFYEVDSGSGVFTFHPYLDGGASASDAEANVRAVVDKLGGRVEEVLHRRIVTGWFPHFSGADVRAGAYGSLASMQGAKCTYFVGELFAGVGVPHETEYATAIAARVAEDLAATGATPAPRKAAARARAGDAAVVGVSLAVAIAAMVTTYRAPLLCFAVLVAVAAALVARFHSRRNLVLAATGVVLGPLAEIAATRAGLWTYAQPELFGVPLWIFPMWWMYPIAVTRLAHAAVGVLPSSRTPAVLALGAAALVVAIMCGLGLTHPLAAAALAATVLALLVSSGATRADVAIVVAGGLIGPVAELLPVHFGAWWYPTPGPLGLPLWLLPGYAAFGLAVVRAGLALATPNRGRAAFSAERASSDARSRAPRDRAASSPPSPAARA